MIPVLEHGSVEPYRYNHILCFTIFWGIIDNMDCIVVSILLLYSYFLLKFQFLSYLLVYHHFLNSAKSHHVTA
jgi:hypothetical protein